MTAVWGKVVGLGLGVFGGPVGAAFGLLIGHLLDLVGAEFHLRRTLARFLSDPSGPRPKWVNVPAAVAALAVVSVTERQWRPGPAEVEAFALATEAGSAPGRVNAVLRWLAVGPVRSTRYLDAATALDIDASPERLAVCILSLPASEDRARVIEVCRSTLQTQIRGLTLSRLRTLAQLSGLSDDWIEEELQQPPPALTEADREDCEILGISQGATIDDVKRAYRRLAAQFHPDTVTGLSEDQREASSEAFVKIRAAYDRVMQRIGSPS